MIEVRNLVGAGTGQQSFQRFASLLTKNGDLRLMEDVRDSRATN